MAVPFFSTWLRERRRAVLVFALFCTVFIGNDSTRMIGGNMVTPRGYRDV